MSDPVVFHHPDAEVGIRIIRTITENAPVQTFLNDIPMIMEGFKDIRAKEPTTFDAIKGVVGKFQRLVDNFQHHDALWGKLILRREASSLVDCYGLHNLGQVKPTADKVLADIVALLSCVIASDAFPPWNRHAAQNAFDFLHHDMLWCGIEIVQEDLGADHFAPVATVILQPQSAKPESRALVKIETGIDKTPVERAAAVVTKPAGKFGVVDGGAEPVTAGPSVAMGKFKPKHIDPTRGRMPNSWGGVVQGSKAE